MADRSLGPAALTHVVQRAVARRLYRRVGVASLAGRRVRRLFVPRLERVLSAHDFYRDRHFIETTPAHDGRRGAIHGAPGADDAGAAHRRMADHPIWMARGDKAGVVLLYRIGDGDDDFSAGDG